MKTPKIRKADPSDVKDIIRLLVELAVYEKEPDAVKVTEEELIKDGFGFSEIRKGRKKGTLVSTLKEPMLNIPTILIGLKE